jgi:hypothetical protein
MQSNLIKLPEKKDINFIEKCRKQIPTFIMVVNAEGPIKVIKC